ncbi:MAG: DNA polymerase III subunit gamma/tau [Thermodesulfobacteriota bacterium]
MSYLVIARKWRPKLFEEVVGQEHVTRTLRNAIASAKIGHAYIFSGPRGVGKTTVARILARALNCEEGPTPTPCNSCRACREITAGSSIDVLEIDGASNTGVDNIRDLRENINYMPSRGRYRVYIIDEVHMLSTPAFNALLKTLEEPPPHAIFIFATTEVHKVIPTILSRCQRFDFKRIPFRDIQEHLKVITGNEGITIDEQGIYLIAREADGSLRDAQSYLDQVIAFAGEEITVTDVVNALGLMDRSLLYDLSMTLLEKDGEGCLNILESIYDFGYDFKRLSLDMLEHIRDLTVVKVVDNPEKILDMPDSEVERLKELSSVVNLPKLQMIFNIMTQCHEVVSRSSSPRFVVEMALLKAVHLDDMRPIESVIKGLEDLSRGVGGGGDAPQKENPRAGMAKSSPAPSGQKTDVVEFIKGKSRHLASCLESARIAAEGGEVTFEVQGSFYNYLADNKERLESICRDFFGERKAVMIMKSSSDEPPQGGQRVGSDTLVDDAVRIFGGRVVEPKGRNAGKSKVIRG